MGTGEQGGVEGKKGGKSKGKPVMVGFGVCSPGWRKVPGVSWRGVRRSAQNFVHMAGCQAQLFPAFSALHSLA